jgi:hypothetical protein
VKNDNKNGETDKQSKRSNGTMKQFTSSTPNLKALTSHQPPQVNDFWDIEKLKLKQKADLTAIDPKQKFFDELFALDNLQLEKKIQNDLVKQQQFSSSFIKSPLAPLAENKKYKKHKKMKKKYLFNIFKDELENLPSKQNTRIVRNLVDYIRFYCPSHRQTFRLMDIEELLFLPFTIPSSFHNILHLIQPKQSFDGSNNNKPPTFSSVPTYSGSLAESASASLLKWKIPSKDVKIEDEMTRKLPSYRKTAGRNNNDYPTSVPNTAATHQEGGMSPLSKSFEDPFQTGQFIAGKKKLDHSNSSALTAMDRLIQHSSSNEDDLQLKYQLELVLRFVEYFVAAGWKPLQWFDTITDYKRDKFQQNLYYNEFYYGFTKFCKEMGLIYFKEAEIELIFEYFIRMSMWSTFQESIQQRRNLLQLKLQEEYAMGNFEATEADIELPPQDIFPYIRRHDFKVGLKKLKLSNKRLLWLNHQASLLSKCSHYIQILKISLYHYSVEIMRDIYHKPKNKNYKNSTNNTMNSQSIDDNISLNGSVMDDEMSIISMSSIQNMKNLQLLDDKIINLHQLEAMVSKLVNDVMIFHNCKDVNKTMEKYMMSKHGGGGGGKEEDELSDLSDEASAVRRSRLQKKTSSPLIPDSSSSYYGSSSFSKPNTAGLNNNASLSGAGSNLVPEAALRTINPFEMKEEDEDIPDDLSTR